MKCSLKIMTGLALACLAGTVVSAQSLENIVRKANRGDRAAQEELASRYAGGNGVVKDEILSEQWRLRANPKMSPTSGGNANASIQKKNAEKAAAEKRAQITAEKPDSAALYKQVQEAVKEANPSTNFSAPSETSNFYRNEKEAPRAAPKPAPAAQPKRDDFQLTLRKASQGDRAALNKIRNDAALRRRFEAYAKTPEGKSNPFVREVQNRLKH